MISSEKKGFFHPTYNKRLFFFIITDIVVFFIAIILSFSIRLGVTHLGKFINEIILFYTVITFFKIILMSVYRVYSFTWKYFSINDAIKIVASITIAQIISSLLLFIYFYSESFVIVPRSLFFLDYFISLFMILGLRSIKRFFLIYFRKGLARNHNVIIYGAGDGGEQIIRDILKDTSKWNPVAIIDDDKTKLHSLIHGIRVEGTLYDINRVMMRNDAKNVIIAIPSMGKERLRDVYDIMIDNGIKQIKILPPAEEILNEEITIKSLKDVDIMDLIGREIVDIDVSVIVNYLNNKTVLVTGAGGSIGSEIVNQIARFDIKRIIALDIDETELFYLRNSIMRKYNKHIDVCLADVRDTETIEKFFNNNTIDVVYHCAALKHVPLCEDFPYEAVKTNILGTNNLIESSKGRIERFIFISTDKAVNPSSVMGATKRICEYLVKNAAGGKTIYSAVRFGNVLGSRGSVIPIFKNQIESGGPITVTHPEMKRFFMTIPEAVLLVLEAGGASQGGETFILDMGEPVLIKNIAERMIQMYGYEIDEIGIEYSGIRPGEKLFEELVMDEEGTENTRFEKIFKAKSGNIIPNRDLLIDIFSKQTSEKSIRKYLSEFIPTYHND